MCMVLRVAAAFCALLVLMLALALLLAPRVVVSNSVIIARPPSRVWAILTDLPNYPQWNPKMRLAGTLTPGAVIENIEDPGPDQIVFWPTVLVADPDRELLWRGHLLLVGRFWLPRLLDADHGFQLRAVTGGTLFTQSETLRGVVLWLWDARQLTPDFAAMDAALKARAEAAP